MLSTVNKHIYGKVNIIYTTFLLCPFTGGPYGFHRRVFTASEVEESTDSSAVTLSCTSPDGEEVGTDTQEIIFQAIFAW